MSEAGSPVISVDTKKKELVGDFKNPVRTGDRREAPSGCACTIFSSPNRAKAIPYGVYDLTRDEGWVSVGIDHDTAHFAVNSIRSWWQKMGRSVYGGASQLLITADAEGATGRRRACGRPSCRSLPTAPASPSPCVTTLPAPANGTRSNIGSSATSP